MSDTVIHSALSPCVAILASPDVDRVIAPNHIDGLAHLLRPFQASVSQLNVRTSQLETRLCSRFPLRFDNLDSFTPPQQQHQHQHNEDLLDSVSQHITTHAKQWVAHLDAHHQQQQQHTTAAAVANDDDAGDDHDHDKAAPPPLPPALARCLRSPNEQQTPWFVHFRDRILNHRTLQAHGTFDHPVALLLAVSSASPDPMNDFARLYEAAQATPSAGPFHSLPYVDPNVLRYYLLIHDVHTSGPDLAQSRELLDHVKRTYGLHCCLLAINSATDGAQPSHEVQQLWSDDTTTTTSDRSAGDATDDDHRVPALGRLLDDEDIRRLRGFVRELAAQSIVPFMERCVQQWNEQLANSRKGLTGRFFGAGRKLFGSAAAKAAAATSSGSSSSAAGAGGYNSQHDFYPFSSVEAQTRRLADFAFTIRDYRLAAATYDVARKDFASDKAWRHSAAANEMLGLSHLLHLYTSRSPPIDVDGYLSQACHEYGLHRGSSSGGGGGAGTAGVDHLVAPLRATLLYYEAYRTLEFYRPAPIALQRMAAASDEVFAALLLEQAAMADLRRRPTPALRKCALHLVMAAHRYQACGQKALSLRCYDQAAALYRGRCWSVVEDHLERELGMQAYNDGDADAAVAHLSSLLRPGLGSADEHDDALQGLLTAYKYAGSGSGNGKPPIRLPQPIFDPRRARIRTTAVSDGRQQAVWAELEAQFLENGFPLAIQAGTRPRKRPATLSSGGGNRVAKAATIWLDAVVENPLNTAIEVRDIRLQLAPDGSGANGDGDGSTAFEADDVGTLSLAPREVRPLSLSLRITQTGTHRVSGISFVLADELPVAESLLEKRGKRLTATREQRLSPAYAPDETLRIHVHEAEPAVAASLALPSSSSSMLLGEERVVELSLRNTGEGEVSDLRFLCSEPEAVAVLSTPQTKDGASAGRGGSFTVANTLSAASSIQPLGEASSTLAPGEQRRVSLLIRAPRLDTVALHLLIVFAGHDERFYTSRLVHTLNVQRSIEAAVSSAPTRDGVACTYALAVDVRNTSHEVALEVSGIEVVAPRWRLVLPAGRDEGPTKLDPLQTARLRGVLERVDTDSSADEVMTYTVARLRALLSNREGEAGVPPPVTVQRSSLGLTATAGGEGDVDDNPVAANGRDDASAHLALMARREWRLNTLSREFNTVNDADRRSAFTAWEGDEVEVWIYWTLLLPSSSLAGGEVVAAARRSGRVAVYGTRLGPSVNYFREETGGEGREIRSLYAATAAEKEAMLRQILASRLGREGVPLVVGVRGPRLSSSASAVADEQAEGRKKVSMTLRNYSSNEVEYTLRLLDSSSSSSSSTSLIGGGRNGIEPDATERAPPPPPPSEPETVDVGRWIGRTTLRGRLSAHSGVVLSPSIVGPHPAGTRGGGGGGRGRTGRWEVDVRCFLPSSSSSSSLATSSRRGETREVARFTYSGGEGEGEWALL